jgi:cephalosporin-C deacetylase-like acetyl esterase
MNDWRVFDSEGLVAEPARMLPDLLNRLAEPVSRERRAFWEGMRTRDDVARRQNQIRTRFLAALGEFPKRTPLNPQVVDQIEFPGYTLEKLIYESRPHYFVPANLYVPRHVPPPYPTMLVSCGHYANGKAAQEYQSTCIGLARKGCLVMIIDPMGQGERQDYFDTVLDKSMLGGPVMEHHYAGDPGYLLGLPFPHHRIWDKMRALDFLYGRDDVDRERLGCVGHSGGGAMAVLMAAADERIRLTVASSPGGSCEWTVLPAGASSEERLADLLTLFAPRPLLVYYGENEPGWQMAQRLEPLLAKIYSTLGAREAFHVCSTPGGHDHDRDKREQVYGWVDRWFLSGKSGAAEPEIEPQPDADVQCTTTGQVNTALESRPLWQVHRDLAREIRSPRSSPSTPAELEAYREEIVIAMRRRLGSMPATAPLEARTRNRQSVADGRVTVERLSFAVEEGIWIPALLFGPQNQVDEPLPALLCVHELGKAVEAGPGGLYELLARQGQRVLAIDARGLGETALAGAPYGDGAGLSAHGSLFGHDAVHAVRSLSLDRTLFGMRLLDTLRAAEYLRGRPDVDVGRIRVAGRGMGALLSLYAAALDPRLAGALCEEGLLTYQSVVSHPEYAHFLNVFLPGVLRDYDLPDTAVCVAPRPLLLLNAVDHARRRVAQEAVEVEYAAVRQAYAAANATEQFVIRGTIPQHEAWRRELYRWWLNREVEPREA